MIHYQRKGIVIRDALVTDLELWDRWPMRKAEVEEVWAANHFSPREAVLMSCLASTRVYTVLHDGKLVCMFGVVPESLLANRANVWLLTTEEINNMKIQFLKLSRHVIAFLRDKYPVLYNWVDCRNEQCIRWLAWAGASFFPTQSYGPEGLPFQPFVFGGL